MLLLSKLLGNMFVLASAVLCGMDLESGLRKKWLFFRELSESAIFLEKEMISRRTPVREALLETSARSSSDVGALLHSAASRIDSGPRQSFHLIWETAVRENAICSSLDEEHLRAVLAFSTALCNTDTVRQKVLLEKQHDRLDHIRAELETEYRRKGRLYRILSAAAGVFLILLFL